MSADSSPVRVIALVTAVLGLITAVLLLVNEARKGSESRPSDKGTSRTQDFNAATPPPGDPRPPAATTSPPPAPRTTGPAPTDDPTDDPSDDPTEDPTDEPTTGTTSTSASQWVSISVCDELSQGAAYERADVLIGYPATPAVIQVSASAPHGCQPYRLAGAGVYGYSVTVYLYNATGAVQNTYFGRGQVKVVEGSTYNVMWNAQTRLVELAAG